jgi:heme exporter protein A
MRIVAENLGGARGGRAIFSGISFDLGEGESLLLTGPNGAGKSTLLRIIAGLLEPDEGSVGLRDGNETWPDISAASHFLSTENAMKTALTVTENLAFWQEFLGEPHLEIDEALEMVGLHATRGLPFGYLSTGQRRRISIARLLVSYRPVWLLDEPTAGLDKASEKQFADLMRVHLEDGGLIIAATHLPLGLEGAREIAMGQEG